MTIGEEVHSRDFQMKHEPFRPAFAVTVEVRGETFHGRYWPHEGGVRVSFTDAEGKTSVNWAASAPTPAAQSVLARIVLRELVDAQHKAPKETETLIVPVPAGVDTELLAARIAVEFGVVSVRAGASNLEVEVQPQALSKLTSTLGEMAELQHSGRVIIRHIIKSGRKLDVAGATKDRPAGKA